MPTVSEFRSSLEKVTENSKAWFMASTIANDRDTYFAKGKLGDNGSGAVYAYFDKNGVALYVGEASRPIKRRMHDKTSPHKLAAWWESWATVRFLQVQNQTDRLTLELLLILSLKPSFNSKPGARNISAMFINEA